MDWYRKLTSISQWQATAAALAVIALLGGAVYANTLTVPWYLDDFTVLDDDTVRDLRQALSMVLTSSRGLVNLTFAANYRLGGTDLAGYHLVNLAIHLVTAGLVLLVLKRIFPRDLLVALGGALIFAVHPLQTQSVTYVFQRASCLAGMFFFLAVYLYLRWREGGERAWLPYAGALLCGALAVLAKQNAAVLPVALLLLDRFFPGEGEPRSWRRQLLFLAPFCLAPALLGIKGLFLDPLRADGLISNVGAVENLAHLRNNTPLNYLVTQFAVVWLYLRLLFVPYGQALDYDVPVVTTPWHWPSLLGLLGIVLLLAAAIGVRRRQPALSAGLLWFFLALSVESTIIPLDTVFEHRLYVPMFGFAMVVMSVLARLPRRPLAAAIVLVTALLGGLSWQRNSLWNEPVAFYEDNLRRAPRSERVLLNLGNAYTASGRFAEARRCYEQALAINPDYVLTYINLSRIYAKEQNYRQAVALVREGLRIDPTHYGLYNNLGVYLNVLGEYREAAKTLQTAILIRPNDPLVRFNLGAAYQGMGLPGEAIVQYRRAIELGPADYKPYFFLGTVLHEQGDRQGALQAFLASQRLNPTHADTLFNIVLVAVELGDQATAKNFLAQLQAVDPEAARRFVTRMR